MTAEDNTIAIAIIKPQDGIDEGTCVAAVSFCGIEERRSRVSIHNIIDVSQRGFVQKNRSRFSSRNQHETLRKCQDSGAMSGGLTLRLSTRRVQGVDGKCR